MADKEWDPGRYPALAAFLDGYVHQEFRLEHGSARGAAEAYLREASAAQIDVLRAELDSVERALAGEPLARWRAALLNLGGAWCPRSMREVRAVIGALRRGRARS